MRPNEGDEIYYTGDMANESAYGRVARAYTDRWGSFFDIEWLVEAGEEPRDPWLGISVVQFDEKPGPAKRFWLRSEYAEYRRAKIEAMRADMEKLRNK